MKECAVRCFDFVEASDGSEYHRSRHHKCVLRSTIDIFSFAHFDISCGTQSVVVMTWHSLMIDDGQANINSNHLIDFS